MLTGHARDRLVLWDVDHTLIETRGVGVELFRAAFEAVTGGPVVHHVEVTGRTEPAIFAEALRRHGIKPSEELMQRYAGELAAQYLRHTERLRRQGRALPGAPVSLASLAQQPGIVQTVLTGNLRRVAEVKLRTFGVHSHLDLQVGAYGDDSDQRPPLVAVAQKRAAAAYGVAFALPNTVIVGDTTHDVLTARLGGARIIAVATGRDSIDDLHQAGAAIVLPDLTDAASLTAAVLRSA